MTVDALALGCASLGNLYRAISDDDASATVDAAWDAGIRAFDTAPHYGVGLSERRLGDALRMRPREDLTISTKVGRLLADGSDPDTIFVDVPALHSVFDFSRDGIMRSLESSLERLGLDRVDLVHVHDPENHMEEALAEAVPVLVQLRDEKVIGRVGVGMNYVEPLARFAREADIDCVLVAGRYTLLDQTAADELLPLCHERGVAVIAAAVFNSGVLADPRPGAPYAYAPVPDDVLRRALAMRDVCEAFGVPLRAAALQFPLRRNAVTCVLPGAQTAAEVQQLAEDFARDLPAELWDALGDYTHSK